MASYVIFGGEKILSTQYLIGGWGDTVSGQAKVDDVLLSSSFAGTRLQTRPAAVVHLHRQ